jgi:hypothetical protein
MNYGDCFSYALAKVRGLPLLYKGNDSGRPTSKARHLERRHSGRRYSTTTVAELERPKVSG